MRDLTEKWQLTWCVCVCVCVCANAAATTMTTIVTFGSIKSVNFL